MSDPDDRTSVPDRLGSGEYFARVKGQTTGVIQSMAAVLTSNEASIAEKTEAINVLGFLRAKEAVPLLVTNITLCPYQFVKELPPLDRLYPCVGALIDIGNPASEALLDRLELPTSDLEARLLLHALCEIETVPFARAKIQARRGAVGETQENKERLTRLLGRLPGGTITTEGKTDQPTR